MGILINTGIKNLSLPFYEKTILFQVYREIKGRFLIQTGSVFNTISEKIWGDVNNEERNQ
jgi:hypothetical protein